MQTTMLKAATAFILTLLMMMVFPLQSLSLRLTPLICRASSRRAACRRHMSMMNDDAATSLPPVPHNAHRIVLMRHGESDFNNANVFTGWCDVALSQRGVVEANEAGQVFASHNLVFRKCYSSLLTRSIVTAQRSLEAAGVSYTPMEYDWRLNERHYGALQGLSKDRTADRLGKTLVMQWRRSYYATPPAMTEEHPHYDIINNDARYRNVNVPETESLEDCQARVIDAWKDIAKDCTKASETDSPYTLVVAHANSLRALVMYLDDIPPKDIEGLNIPTAIPFYYDIDKATGMVLTGVSESDEEANPVTFKYIADERKKRNFLERRRAANDPFLWALHDDQVARSMLLAGDELEDEGSLEGIDGLVEEAARNTEIFSPSVRKGKDDGFYIHEH